jgi:two-component system sensor histidine kinase KdpD
MRATGAAGVLAGVVAVVGFQQFRSRLRENRVRAELDHLVALLPTCPDIDQALAVVEEAFLRAFRLPLAVFDKFNRAGRTGETGGIGLGLSICKGLVEAHRGRIWAEWLCPHGTAVALRLPLSPGGTDDGQYHTRTCSG